MKHDASAVCTEIYQEVHFGGAMVTLDIIWMFWLIAVLSLILTIIGETNTVRAILISTVVITGIYLTK